VKMARALLGLTFVMAFLAAMNISGTWPILAGATLLSALLTMYVTDIS